MFVRLCNADRCFNLAINGGLFMKINLMFDRSPVDSLFFDFREFC